MIHGKKDEVVPVSFSRLVLRVFSKAKKKVVVIKNGKIISEQYADGYDMNSHGTSWSMAKSYYAALIGISIDKGEIGSLDDAVAKYLDYFNDERSEITIRDLLDLSLIHI